MRRIFLFLSLMILVLFSNSACAEDFTEFYKRYSPSVVKVEHYDVQKQLWLHTGSGFVLDDYTVVSAAHVFNWGPKPEQFRLIINGKTYGIRKFWVSQMGVDVAVMGLNMRTSAPGLRVAMKNPEIGSETFTMGNPMWMQKLFTVGNINQMISSIAMGDGPLTVFFNDMIGFSNPVFSGDSGGPVLGRGGQVYGVVFGGWTDPLGTPLGPYSIFTPAKTIRESLGAYRKWAKNF